MLRVGLTGELGSGKSTVARLLAERGAIVLSSDDMARAMMRPGHAVFGAIVERFGPASLLPDGRLNRSELARLAFDPEHPRVEELNAIVHPAVLAEQERRVAEIARTHPHAVVIIESALLLTTKHAGGDEPWRARFDQVILVTAPEALKVQRYLDRVAGSAQLTAPEAAQLRTEALNRLAAQRIPAPMQTGCLLLHNDSELSALLKQVETLWPWLLEAEARQLQA